MRTRVLLLGLWVLIFGGSAGADFCESCYSNYEVDRQGNVYQDAMCCLTDSYQCDFLEQDGWSQQWSGRSWCSVTWDEIFGGYNCNGSGTCSTGGGGVGGGGGGGGGGSQCHLGPGELYCPASCSRCTRQLF